MDNNKLKETVLKHLKISPPSKNNKNNKIRSPVEKKSTTQPRKVAFKQDEETGKKFLTKDIFVLKEILNKGYKVKKRIGSGSYAQIFKAINLNTKLEVALKVIELKRVSKNYKESFLKTEVHIIRLLEHQNIIKFFESFNTTTSYVMVMELAENGTFCDMLIHHGATPEFVARKLFKMVTDGVNYMHSQLIAHRDLKLENLLLSNDMIPKICDFSLSIIWDGENLCTTLCGTPVYFPPELYLRKPYNPLGYDVWSLGVCIFIILNDKLPFGGADDNAVIEKQLSCDWTFRKGKEFSQEVKIILNRMLDPNPSSRITSNQLIRCQWFS